MSQESESSHSFYRTGQWSDKAMQQISSPYRLHDEANDDRQAYTATHHSYHYSCYFTCRETKRNAEKGKTMKWFKDVMLQTVLVAPFLEKNTPGSNSPDESSFPDSTKYRINNHILIFQITQNNWLVYRNSICCAAGKMCWHHGPSSSVTHHNEHFTQILSLLSLSATPAPSFTSLYPFFPPPFPLVTTMESLFHFWKSFSLVSSQRNAPSFFHRLHFHFLSFFLFNPAFPRLSSLRQSHCNCYCISRHFSIFACIELMTRFALQGHSLTFHSIIVTSSRLLKWCNA